MTHPTKKELEQKLKETLQTSATIQIGKNGLTQALIEETMKQLENNDVVKVKVLKSVDNPDNCLNDLAKACDANLWRKIGRVGILYLNW